MDANFKLKQKERGFDDPPLANGFAYMVSNKKLLEHLAQCKDDKILKADVRPRLLMGFPILTSSIRPQPVALPSTPSTTHIQKNPLVMLSQVLEVSIVLAMDSSDRVVWWTCRKENGMSLCLFKRSILTRNQLCEHGPRVHHDTLAHYQFRHHACSRLLRHSVPVGEVPPRPPLAVYGVIIFQPVNPLILHRRYPKIPPPWSWEDLSTKVQHQLHERCRADDRRDDRERLGTI